MGNSMEVPEKIKNRITIGSSNPTSGIYPKELNKISKKHLQIHVQCSIIHKSQEVEATWMFINKWIKKM